MTQLITSYFHKLRALVPIQLNDQSIALLSWVFFLALCTTIVLLIIKNAGLKKTLHQKQEQLDSQSDTINQHNLREAKLITLLKNERKHTTDKLRLLEQARGELKLQFENLAGRIFDDKSSKFSELNREKLDTILQPFNKELLTLRQEIQTIYQSDSRERLNLKHEIQNLRELNQQINQEAINLTNALKNDTKTQGNWGELVLEQVLQRSGLRNGFEYDTQGAFRTHDNRLQKPDVIVHLPESRDIIIDSKVSLVHWERYVNCDADAEKTEHLRQQVKAVYDHVSTLSGKDYPGLAQIHCLDFVLMFMPIEAAFSAVCLEDKELMATALKKNIIIVTPTTLLATLRTVENIWKFEQQSKSSLEIARRAGLMYDKFRSFVEEIEKMGKQLANCRTSYDNALLKLTRGRGNLVSQAEHLRELGVQVKKELPRTITDLTDHDTDYNLKN
ncbi:DNA recombination protein RmuC [Desulforhopalus sp. IMCC35007]|uniref:DNA recombination protein RmuC n=1 Tax=Desulforhopalus sp. IMCC35007 TaxID=2569543 RepID=UPI0010AECD0B|nr:DNA recombination protein RmuC [Desulforhopalus sp. IMCC35007]TKB08379.1 DNA recombination protein RmuC [Desulforhopalus sp. IMCC35007]